MNKYKYFTPLELADELLNYLPRRRVKSVIDISCGEFNLIQAAQKRFPQASFVGVDIDKPEATIDKDISFYQQDGRTFAIQQHTEKVSYDLILTNPPFGRLKKEDRVFEKGKQTILCSRFECEMMYANFLLTHPKSSVLAILPSTFVEGDLYKKYRELIAELYEVRYLIKLPDNVFVRRSISAYALILICKAKEMKSRRETLLCNAYYTNSKWSIQQHDVISKERILEGNWIVHSVQLQTGKKIKISNIYRGTINSSLFSGNNKNVLHCSSNFMDGIWVPQLQSCNEDDLKKLKIALKYAQDGDIVINRIGRCAGFWTKYHGEKILVSDCLIVVRGGKNVVNFLKKNSKNGKIVIPVKGVATKYVTMKDLQNLYFCGENNKQN